MLYYIHGYQSSPTSIKATLFSKTLRAHPIKYREGHPEDIILSECLKQIAKTIQSDPNPVLIGSSFGGFLAAATALFRSLSHIFLLNPALPPPETTIDTIPHVPKRILTEMISLPLFEQKLSTKIDIFLGTKDTIVPNQWSIRFAAIQEATIHFFNDDHTFSENLEKLPSIITKILSQ